MNLHWDAFISHASEDKDTIARPLCKQLQRLGLRVWFDETTLVVGDSLRRSIDAGLARSRFGIVIISPNFLKKEWPQRELDGLVAREIEGIKVILPVWHQIKSDQVRLYSPTLADRLAASSSEGIDKVAHRLLEAIGQGTNLLKKADKGAAANRENSIFKMIYCTRCGATPGVASQCNGYTSHNFASSSANIVYCTRCGAMPGEASQCNGYTSHNFTSSSTETVYCARCGATPGVPSECNGYTSHNFTSSSAALVYCARCGAMPGEASQCNGYTSHNFTSSSAETVYCTRCGATPGIASQCSGYTSHNFTSP